MIASKKLKAAARMARTDLARLGHVMGRINACSPDGGWMACDRCGRRCGVCIERGLPQVAGKAVDVLCQGGL